MLRSDTGLPDTVLTRLRMVVGIVGGERFGEMRMPFQVDGHEVPVGFGFAEQLDQRGLADLTRTAQDQRFAPRAMQPLLQVTLLVPVHPVILPLHTRQIQSYPSFYGYIFMYQRRF